MTCKIVVTNWVHTPVIRRLERYGRVESNPDREPWPRERLLEVCADADAMLAFMTDHVDAEFLAACPRLRIIAGALKGYDNFDGEACARRGVWLTVVPDLLTAPTAELAIGLTISVARMMLPGDRYIRRGAFEGWRPRFYGAGLEGASVGLVGMGAVGRAIATRLRGFGVRLRYFDRDRLAPSAEAEFGVEWMPFQQLLRASDFVILAVSLNDDTVATIDRDALASMKPDAYLVNPARGSLVDEDAVADALVEGRLAGYAADVFACEDWARSERPAGIPQSLIDLPHKTVLTPHLGSAVDRVRLEIALAAAGNIADCFEGRRPAGAVNEPKLRQAVDA